MTAPGAPTAPTGPAGTIRALLRSPRHVLPVTLPLLALVVTGLVLHQRGYYLDLEVYRIGVQAWLDGGDPYGALPPTLGGVHLPFIYPPFAILLMVPLTVAPWVVAWVVLFGLSTAGLALTLYVVAKRAWPAGGRTGALVVASAAFPLALLLEPVLETIKFGQINVILMALVVLDCLAPHPRWPRGLLVGLAAAIKLTPAVFLLYFLLRRDMRAAMFTVGTAAAATAVGFLVDAAASGRYWFGGPAAGVSGSPFYTNQTFQAVLVRAGISGPTLTVLGVVLAVAALLLVVPAIRRAEPATALVATALFGLLASPTSWSHHWVWVAPALLVALAEAVRRRSAGWAVLVATAAVVFSVAPFRYLPGGGEAELRWSGWEQLLGATYVLFGAAVLVAGFLAYRRRAAGARSGTGAAADRPVP